MKFNYVSVPTSQVVVTVKKFEEGREIKNRDECMLSDFLVRDTEGMGVRAVTRGPSDLIIH